MANVAVVHFRTVPNGAYRYMKGLRRGFWRVLIVKDAKGAMHLNSPNVVGVHWEGREGIDGVTERSRYAIEDTRRHAIRIAAEFNQGL